MHGRISFLLLFAAVATSAVANECNPYTLEYLIDSSDVVVKAKVASVQPLAEKPAAEGYAWYRIGLNVLEPLKGNAASTISVIAESKQPEKLLSDGVRAKSVSIWFLKNNPADDDYIVGDLFNRTLFLNIEQAQRWLLVNGFYTIYGMDAVVKIVQSRGALRPRSDYPSLTIKAPGKYSPTIGRFVAENTLTTTLDEEIEAKAFEWVRPTVDPGHRLIGVRILRQFPSAKATEFLRALIYDTGGIRSIYWDEDFKTEAAQVLTEWQAAIPTTPSIIKSNNVSNAPIRVQVNGVEVSFKGVTPPRIIDGKAYARACTISKPLGVEMGTYSLDVWQGVSVKGRGMEFLMPRDSRTVWFSDHIEEAPVYAVLIDKKTLALDSHRNASEGFFPVRYVVERLGGKMKWDSVKRIVQITIPPVPTS